MYNKLKCNQPKRRGFKTQRPKRLEDNCNLCISIAFQFDRPPISKKLRHIGHEEKYYIQGLQTDTPGKEVSVKNFRLLSIFSCIIAQLQSAVFRDPTNLVE